MTLSIARAHDILHHAELLCSHEQVQAALHKVAQQINAKLADQHPLVLSVMGGAVVFSGQLLPLLNFPLDFDYVHVSRYGDARHGGAMHWKVEPRENVRGRPSFVYYSYNADDSDRPLPFITDIRWGRLGTTIK